MKLADGLALFGEWFADLPELDNPGLTEANNALPVDRTYKSFRTLSTASAGTGAAVTTSPISACHVQTGESYGGSVNVSPVGWVYLGTSTGLFTSGNQGGSFTSKAGATYPASNYWSFAQYNNLLVAASAGATGSAVRVLHHTIGSTTAFTVLSSSAPVAQVVGSLPNFVIAGQLKSTTTALTVDRPNVIQWSAINNPTNWPTPGTSTAVAAQAGEQILNATFGKVQGIFGTDQYGVVLQEAGITRVTYVGGSIVFQFNELDSASGIGAFFPSANIQVNGLVYFISSSGFFATDGMRVVPIGDGKVDRYFWNDVNADDGYYRVTVGHDQKNKLIYWAYPTAADSDGFPSRILIFNYFENRWTSAEEDLHVLVTPPTVVLTGGLGAFNSSGVYCKFSGTVAAATLTTAEMEHNRGGYSLVQGVKPLVQGTAPAVTVALGTRNDQDPDSLTFTSETTATASTGFCDFRSSARYHRARITVTGEFESAQGIEWQAIRQGAR